MRVFIEAGHSDRDPGAVVGGVTERSIVVEVAHRFAALSGGAVSYFAKSRPGILKGAMTAFLRSLGLSQPDVLISLHVNSSASDPHLHECIAYHRRGRPDSEHLAHLIAEEASSGQWRFAEKSTVVVAPWNRGGKMYSYPPLRYGKVASVLVELGFLSDLHAREAMQRPEWWDRAAHAIDHALRRLAG
jgi:N-acetylmuramoyl-L-alanine amidase